jgi:ribonuclease P protein component
VLPRGSRLHLAGDFRSTIRRGVRVGRPTLVLHVSPSTTSEVRVGMVVSKGVGNAVTRNRVKRRLRHLAAAELTRTPPGTDVVVRALPPSATAAAGLGRDLASAWSAALRRLGDRA